MSVTNLQCHICGHTGENATAGKCHICGTDTQNTDAEKVLLSETCDFCKDGTFSAVVIGRAVLTNKRILVGKSNANTTSIIIAGIASVIICIILFRILKLRLSIIEASLIGGIVGVIILTIIKRFANSSNSKDFIQSIAFNIPLEEISAVEYGNKGIRTMLVINTKNGDLCKLSVKDKDKWKTTIENSPS